MTSERKVIEVLREWLKLHPAVCHREVLVAVLAEHDAQEAKRLDTKVIARAAHLLPKPLIPNPAEKLAEAVRQFLDPNDMRMNGPQLQDALDDYASTKNSDPTLSAVLGSPPDPIAVARLLLDVLTGGAFSSLICGVRDEVLTHTAPSHLRWATIDNLKSNLRVLGEKIE
jgi:hypothetical protein